MAVIGLPWLTHILIANDIHFAVATYGVIVLLGLSYLALEWLMPYRAQWNTPAGDLKNDVISGAIAYG